MDDSTIIILVVGMMMVHYIQNRIEIRPLHPDRLHSSRTQPRNYSQLRWATVTSAPTPDRTPNCAQTSTVTKLANGTQLVSSHSSLMMYRLLAATQLANCHSLPAAIEVPTVHSLPTTTQLANSHFPSFPLQIILVSW
jgi:hypothetical protein